jgi:serine/threonine protein kinase
MDEESVGFFDDNEISILQNPEKYRTEQLIKNRYKYVRKIGNGATGIVDLVQDTKTNTCKALKRVRSETTSGLNGAMSEVLSMSRTRHPHLLDIESVFVVSDSFGESFVCFVSRYYQRGDLDYFIKVRREMEQFLSELQICKYMIQLVSATNHLHENRLIHRDIKPANIFVSDDDESLIIGDFGLVKQLDASFASTVAGTIRYMAPEVLTKKCYSYAADVWSLGCVMLDLCTLSLDKNLHTEVISNKNFQKDIRLELERYGFTSQLSIILCKMLDQDQNTRASAKDVLQLLQQHVQLLESGAILDQPTETTFRKCDADDCTNAARCECKTCGGISLCSKCFSDSHRFGVYKRHERVDIVLGYDNKSTMNYYVKQLATWIRESKHFVCFTGAGVSVSSGVPDMRNRDVMKPCEYILCPSITHMALYELHKRGILKHLISTNIDGLHGRSGFPKKAMSEIYGNQFIEVCEKCSKEYIRDYKCKNAKIPSKHNTGRKCDCGGDLNDILVNLNEPIPPNSYKTSLKNASKADLILVLGSRLAISPSCDLPELCKRNIQLENIRTTNNWSQSTKEEERIHRFCIVNLSETQKDHLADLIIHHHVDDVMASLMKELDIAIPEYVMKHTFVVGVRMVDDSRISFIESFNRDGYIASIIDSVKFTIHTSGETLEVTKKRSDLFTTYETRIDECVTCIDFDLEYNLPPRDGLRAHAKFSLPITNEEQSKNITIEFNVNKYEAKVKEAITQDITIIHWLWNKKPNFCPYGSEVSQKLEMAYQAYKKDRSLPSRCDVSDTHYVTFTNMHQVNKEDESKIRKVKRTKEKKTIIVYDTA